MIDTTALQKCVDGIPDSPKEPSTGTGTSDNPALDPRVKVLTYRLEERFDTELTLRRLPHKLRDLHGAVPF
jgi:hypothetical protein